MSGNVVVIGSANVDFSMRVPVFPRKGESVNGGPFLQSFGGKGSNQALAAKRAGAPVAGVFNLGGDIFADQLLALYEREGIEASEVRKNPGLLCGTGIILVDANGDNLICTSLEANAHMTAERIDECEKTIAHADLLMLQMEIPDDAIARAILLAKRHGVRVMLNFAPARETRVPLDANVDILVVNETEAENLTGLTLRTRDEVETALRALEKRNHAVVIVTLGGDGCAMAAEGVVSWLPAFPVAVKDVTAAGDTFCGSLAAALARNWPLPEAVRFACAAGALCVTVRGALPSIPCEEDINAFLYARRGLV